MDLTTLAWGGLALWTFVSIAGLYIGYLLLPFLIPIIAGIIAFLGQMVSLPFALISKGNRSLANKAQSTRKSLFR